MPLGSKEISGPDWSAILVIETLVTATLELPAASLTEPDFKEIVELPDVVPPVMVIVYITPLVVDELVMLEIEITFELEIVKELLVKLVVVTPTLSVHVSLILVVSPRVKDSLSNEPNVHTGASISDQWA